VQLSEQPEANATGLKLQAYYVGTPTGRADLAAHANRIDVLTPDFYDLGGDGQLDSKVDDAALVIASAAGIEVQPLVTNLDFDADKAHAIIANPTGAATVAANLVAEARRRGYKGYQLDFENLHTSDRDGFTRFSASLGQDLAAAGLKYTAAVIPRKLSGAGGILSIAPQASGVYDYPALSRDSRWLTLMAYDQHTTGTPPGPVAAIDWVREVLTGGSAGVDHSRLFLGVPLYYRDWTLGGDTTVGPYSEAAAERGRHRRRDRLGLPGGVGLRALPAGRRRAYPSGWIMVPAWPPRSRSPGRWASAASRPGGWASKTPPFGISGRATEMGVWERLR